jgi:hypothetical protein
MSPRRLVIILALAGGLILVALFSSRVFPGVFPAKADGGGPSPTPLPTHTITLLPTLTTTAYPYPASLQSNPVVTQAPQASTGFACWPLAILLIVVVIILSSWRAGGGARG